jgi:hypothetical protein
MRAWTDGKTLTTVYVWIEDGTLDAGLGTGADDM